MKRRTAQKQETRGQVMEAARSLFASQGVEATTTRQLAEAAGVAVGTVFLHFPDKDALVESLLVDHVEKALSQAFATLPKKDVVARLLHVSMRLIDAYNANPALSRAMLQASLFIQGEDRPISLQLARFQQWLQEELSGACARGELPGVDPVTGGLGFFSLYFGVLVGGLRGDIPAASQRGVLKLLLKQHFQR